jgi:hypothetical protein
MGNPEKRRSRQYKIQLGPGRPLLEREPFCFLLLFSLVIDGIFFQKILSRALQMGKPSTKGFIRIWAYLQLRLVQTLILVKPVTLCFTSGFTYNKHSEGLVKKLCSPTHHKKKKTEAKVCVNILNKIRVTILIVFKHNICK